MLVRNRETFSDAISKAKRVSVSKDNMEKEIKNSIGNSTHTHACKEFCVAGALSSYGK